MLMLSSLVGPEKPPVASPNDVASAQGLFHIQQSASWFTATSLNGGCDIEIQFGERCLVCLEEYKVADELRQLARCSHMFHRDCIDEVCFVYRTFTGRAEGLT